MEPSSPPSPPSPPSSSQPLSPSLPSLPSPPPWSSSLDVVLGRTPLRLALWLLLGVWFMGTWLSEPYLIGRGQDWAYFVHHTTVATRTWSEFGQLPMWNPWACGGIPALANIQTDALSPDLVATLPLDAPVALALRLLLFIVLGLEGAWHYARHHGVRGWGALLAASAFVFSGRFMMIYWDGHLPFYGFALAPWVFLGLERAYERLAWGLVSALALTWIFFFGGAVATPLIGAVMGLIVARDVCERLFFPARDEGATATRRRWYRPLVALGFIAAVTALLALPRLVPVMGTLIAYPRTWSDTERLSVWHISGMLFHPPRSWSYFDIGTSYIGVGVGLAALGALPLRTRHVVKLAVVALLTWDLAMGDAGPLHLWKGLHLLPVVENIRAAFRFTFLLALFIPILAGRALTWLEPRVEAWVARRTAAWPRFGARGKVVLGCAAVGLVTCAVGAHGPLATRAKLGAIPRHEVGLEARGPFHQALGTRWIAQAWPRVNLGTIACFEEQFFPQSPALRGDRKEEQWLVRGRGEVDLVSWSPNELAYRVRSARGTTLVVHQNDAAGWTTDVGRKVEQQGLLAVELPPGEHRVTLTYEEPHMRTWLAVSFATLALIALYASSRLAVRWSRRRRSTTVAAP